MAFAMGDTDLAIRQPASTRACRVGSDLRAARERLGWSLEDTAAYIRIRLPLLTALEDGRTADLPGLVYAVGFVRSYALALGMDPDEMVRRYREETGAVELRSKLDFPAPVPQAHVPAGAVVMLGALLTVAGYVGWYRVSGDHGSSVAVQTVPPRLAPLALPVVPPPPARSASASAPTAPVALAGAYVPPRVSPSAADASVPPPGSLSPVVPAPIVVAPGAALPANHVVLSATADAWVQVRDGVGKIVLSKLMHAGESWPVPDQASGQPPLLLTTGNAGGTVLTVDGKVAPPIGGDGVVMRDVKLDPAALAAGTVSADAAAPH
jgi:cytoskeleton protein RodZ